MYNYTIGREKYSGPLGSLYINPSIRKPIIYIGGQMEYRGHVVERNGYSFDPNHTRFDGAWLYEYPLYGDKSQYCARKFSESFLISLRKARLTEVTLVGFSHGGLIASYATKSGMVSRAIAVHSPILGTPLANPEYLRKYKSLLTKKQELITKAIRLLVDYGYGFQRDNFEGLRLDEVNLEKLLVVGNCIDPQNERNRLILETYEIIRKITGLDNDGVVTFDPNMLKNLGIPYERAPYSGANHFEAGRPAYLRRVLESLSNS